MTPRSLLISCFILGCNIVLSRTRESIHFHENDTYFHFYEKLFQGYNSELDPGHHGKEYKLCVVQVNININSFSRVSVEKMEFLIDMHFTQEWFDPRLKFTGYEEVALCGEATKRVWTPDTYFPNEKEGSIHEVTKRNAVVKISHTGLVRFTQRLRVTLSCRMELQWFPVDIQHCHIDMQSYGHTFKELKLIWSNRRAPVTFSKHGMQSPEFLKQDVKIKKSIATYKTGMFDNLKLDFVLKRQIGFYLMGTYMPFMSIVFISWFSCWISPSAAPARTSIGVVTVLSIMVHNAGIQRSMPHVSYMKALDLYMIISLFFVMMAFMEFCASHYLFTWGKKFEHPDEMTEAEGLDRVARWLLPLSFTIFNVIYWTILITASPN